MNLYLMQHGLSKSKEEDIEQSLSDNGKIIIENSAKGLKNLNVSFDVIFCSSKKRSKETALIVAHAFDFPKDKIIESDKVLPMAKAQESLELIKNNERIFIAGHLPNIKEIITYLISPNAICNIDIQNGGCTKIDIDNDSALLKWHLPANILKKIY
jgi:phosphohistidine phosphatase